MTEVPEHLLQRSRDARRRFGYEVEGDDAASPAPAGAAAGSAAPATTAPAPKAPVPIPESAPPTPPEPEAAWVTAAKERNKIPYWVMPVLVFLPIWLIYYVGTLEDPTRQEGVIYEGSHVYEAHCASCHGATGGGGTGPGFGGGAIVETFASAEAQIAWVVNGTQHFIDAGRTTYGDNGKALAGNSGAKMPPFGEDLTTEEIIAAVFYERVELGGHEAELPLAEAIWGKLEHGEFELEEHLPEGEDLDGEHLVTVFAEVRAELGGGEAAAE